MLPQLRCLCGAVVTGATICEGWPPSFVPPRSMAGPERGCPPRVYSLRYGELLVVPQAYRIPSCPTFVRPGCSLLVMVRCKASRRSVEPCWTSLGGPDGNDIRPDAIDRAQRAPRSLCSCRIHQSSAVYSGVLGLAPSPVRCCSPYTRLPCDSWSTIAGVFESSAWYGRVHPRGLILICYEFPAAARTKYSLG